MYKYNNYTNSKKKISILKTKYRVFKRCAQNDIIIFRNFFKKNSKISFLKKFILNCILVKRCTYKTASVCFISGRYNITFGWLSLKRHTFKNLLTINSVPCFIKKYK